jgi:uncharacterized membrane protein YeaQ/YmgE (transglycosylase-associated protein family)
MVGIIQYLVLGLIAGLLAKLIYPGRQGGGIFATTFLGILGAILGGWLSEFLPFLTALPFAGIIIPVIGAIILIWLWGLIFGKAA